MSMQTLETGKNERALGMFGTEGEESRGEGSWNVLIFSIF